MYLDSLPSVEVLPDFSKLLKLFALKIYELHQLKDIESLRDSFIQYLGFTLAADKLSGTKIAEILLGMKQLKGADMVYMDRSSIRRYNALENKLKKAGREDLLNYRMEYANWENL